MKGSIMTIENSGDDFLLIGPIFGTSDVFVRVTKVGGSPTKSVGVRRRVDLNITPNLLGITREDFAKLGLYTGDMASLAEVRMEYLKQKFLPDINPYEIQWEFRINGGFPPDRHKSPLVQLTLIEALRDEEVSPTRTRRRREDACTKND